MKWLQNTAIWVWLALLAATGLTYWLGEHNAGHALGNSTVLLVFGLACAKGWLVIDVFMGLRHAPAFWRWVMRGWLLVVTAALTAVVLISR